MWQEGLVWSYLDPTRSTAKSELVNLDGLKLHSTNTGLLVGYFQSYHSMLMLPMLMFSTIRLHDCPVTLESG